jgi:6-phosphogluconolactonase
MQLALGFLLLLSTLASAAPKTYVYVGTYTNKGSKGIYVYQFDAASGKLESLGLAAETPNPTFLAIHPNRKFLYAANEVGNFGGERAGSITAFRIEPDGKLTQLNAVSSKGAGPCHVSVDHKGRAVLAANYGGGSVASLPIREDGSLAEAVSAIQHTGSSVSESRQRGPHAHSINLSPDNRFAIAADLGIDKLLVYRFDAATGAITPHDPPSTSLKPGAGPRHFAFHPKLPVAYSINELDSTVTVFAWDAKKGVFTSKQTAGTLPADFTGNNSTAEVVVHPTGRFLYGSNRGHDSIAVFAIAKDGTIQQVEVTPIGARTPRNFAVDPTGQYLFAAGQASDKINLFRIDPKTGKLTQTQTSVEVGAPVCIRFVTLP